MSEQFWRQEGGEFPVDIALCICPHLREFLVIDQRKQLPGRPLVQVFATDTVLDEQFYREVEKEFSYALREGQRPFTTLMALPQVVQVLLRHHSLAAILRAMDSDFTDAPRVAVLLFSGDNLTQDDQELTQTIRDLLGDTAEEETVALAKEHLSRLLTQEQAFEHQVEQDWLRKVIKGSTGDFFTLWEQS